MTTISHDVYAETNPAFCAFVLVEFISGFVSVNAHGPEVPLAYLSLPLALSGDLSDTFEKTNKNTGLMEWVERHPKIHVGLGHRTNGSMTIVTDAIQFACFSNVVTMTPEARLLCGSRKIKKSATKNINPATANAIKHGARLGIWFAKSGSARAVFDTIGLTL